MLTAAGLKVYIGNARSVEAAVDELEQITTLLNIFPFKALHRPFNII